MPDRQQRIDRLQEARQRGAEKYRQALDMLASGASADAAVRRPQRKTGRKDPCWCVRGKKYKSITLVSDGSALRWSISFDS